MTVCPSGVKEAPLTSPRRKLSWWKAGGGGGEDGGRCDQDAADNRLSPGFRDRDGGRWSRDSREHFEIEGEVVRRVESLLRGLLETVPHDPVQPGTQVPDRQGEVRRLLPQDRGQGVGRGRAVERPPSREHLVEDRAEREDVR